MNDFVTDLIARLMDELTAPRTEADLLEALTV